MVSINIAMWSMLTGPSTVMTMLPSAISDAGFDVEVCYGEEIQIGAAEIKISTWNVEN